MGLDLSFKEITEANDITQRIYALLVERSSVSCIHALTTMLIVAVQNYGVTLDELQEFIGERWKTITIISEQHRPKAKA